MKRIAWILIPLTVGSLFATQPPDPDAIQKYVNDGSYGARLNFVRAVGNHRMRKDLAVRAAERLRRAAGKDDGPAAVPPPAQQGMPTRGTNNILVLLIDFPDYAHVNSASLVTSKIFGDGVPAEYPKESLRNYYLRSSYNQLHLQGNVLGWYRMAHSRSWYTTQYPSQNEANRAIILEALQSFDAGHDYSQFDNNGDGKVDYFAVFWAGPDNGWGNFWWGYQWELFNPITLDGVSFSTFSWQWESRPVGSAFEAETIIHETGHALGLPDYYDYDPSLGPGGGVGGLDMMDGNYADHNAFSKFVLDWLTPEVVFAGASSLTLRALAHSPDAVAVMPDYPGGSPFAEYFVVENRFRTNNDTGTPNNGLLIWHVDATLNDRGEDFLHDNSYSSHKLLRLMEADGLEEIEFGDGRADAGDYFNLGETFGPETLPNSHAYDGNETGVTVDSISANAFSMNTRVAVQGTAAGPRIHRTPAAVTESTFEETDPAPVTVGIWASGDPLAYAISDDAAWVSVSPDNGVSSGGTNAHVLTYSVAGLAPGTHVATITITAPGATNSPQTLGVTLTVMGGNIGRAVDNTNLIWTAGGDLLWFEQSSVSHDGEDAAQSGVVGDDEANWIQTTVQGPGQLSFWWKVSSEFDYDFLSFTVDAIERVQAISGSREWEPNTVFITGGPHALRWTYSKDFSVSSGSDAGWVDQVEFVPASLNPTIAFSPLAMSQFGVPGQDAASQTLEIFNSGGGALDYAISDDAPWLEVLPATETSSGAPNYHTVNYTSADLPVGQYSATITITAPGATNSPATIPVNLQVLEGGSPLAEAVDLPTHIWTTGGNADWQAQTAVTYDGVDAAVSGSMTHGQETWIETTIEGPGQMTFKWKASTESGYDYLDCYLDFDWTGFSIDGESDWRQEYLVIPPGTHTVSWVYSKDDSVDEGLDTVWLDQVTFTPGGSSQEVLLSTDFEGGPPAGWQILDNAFSGAVWRFDDPCFRNNLTGGMGTFAIADSDCAEFVGMDTELQTPAVNFTGYTNVMLKFRSDYDQYSSEVGDVDLQINGGPWINLWRRTAPDLGPKTYLLAIPQADNQPDVRVRFHYYNAFYDWFWSVDDVELSGTSTATPPQNYLAEWRQAWEDFDRNYAFFPLKGLDWSAAYDANTNLFAGVSNSVDFAVQLDGVLQGLRDWQVAVRKPDSNWLTYDGTFTNNHPAQPLTNYTGGAAYQNVNGANAIYHAWVFSNLAHVVVTRLDDAFNSISETDLNHLFTTYQNAQGMIVDLRANVGGNETNALRLAGRFTSLPRTYGYSRTRVTGSDHTALTPFAAKLLPPATGPKFTNAVACLIGQGTYDAAEWLTLMFKVCPQVTLVGDRTRGSASNAELFTQTSSGVGYLIPRTLGYTVEQFSFEDRGIAPALAMTPGAGSYSEALKRDYVLERAIAWVRRPQLAAHPRNPAGLVVEWPAGPGSTYTLLRSTNLATAPWLLAPGWTSNRSGINGTMRYTNLAPARLEFYRLFLGP